MGSQRTKKSLGGAFTLSALLLTVFGLIVLFSTSVPLSQQNFGESYYYFKHQIIYGLGVGILLFFIFRTIGYRRLRIFALPFFVVSLGLLALVFIPQLSYSAGGARSWLAIGGFSFQPSELAKLALILYLAFWLDKNKQKAGSTGSVVSFLVITGLASGLILLQPDIGTAFVIGLTALLMYFVAGARLKSLLVLFV